MLVRRPFSVARCFQPHGTVSAIDVIYKRVGRGTKLMNKLRQGDELDIIGPLGHGFERFRDKRNHVLLAGGVGAAGLFMLGEEISYAVPEQDFKLYSLLGTETRKNLILENEFTALNGRVLVSTDDGTKGYHGTVIEMLQDAIKREEISSDCAIYACGPEPMLRALDTLCRGFQIPAQVLIEKRMLCGIGACLVCVCKVDEGNVRKYRDLKSSHMQFNPREKYGYALVCKDGPVFHIDEVIFDE
jgi:dihydroorotate dehydrogenase electron transfer subunit